MFDIGFWELCLIGLVSLLVIGPEKLPKVARIAGFWVGKARHTLTTVKAEINQELHAEEMRQIVEEQQQDIDNVQLILNETVTQATQESVDVLDKNPNASE
jgi:sec-independent protein translocase protein TatB